MGEVVRVIKLQLILEKQLRLVRVLEVDAELVVSVNCDQKTQQLLSEGWLIHTIAQTTVDL